MLNVSKNNFQTYFPLGIFREEVHLSTAEWVQFLFLLLNFFIPLSRWLVGMSRTHHFKLLQKNYSLKKPISYISHALCNNSKVLCTIPLYCQYINPLNAKMETAKSNVVMHEHFPCLFFRTQVQKESRHWYSRHSQLEVRQYFCESVSVYGNTGAASNLNCSLCLREGYICSPEDIHTHTHTKTITHALEDKEPLTQKL